MRTLRLLLGDQLNAEHSWFQQADDQVWYLMMEMRQETDYVMHHVQKVVAFFKAMRAFAAEREAEGHQVIYYELAHPHNQQSLPENVQQLVEEYGFERFEYQMPDEYRLDEQLRELGESLGIEYQAVDTEHFLTQRHELADMFAGKKTYLMETFYRNMRKRYDVMMQDEKNPLTGQWNYDQNNRQPYDGKVPVPEPLSFGENVAEIVELLEAQGVKTFGEIDPDELDQWYLGIYIDAIEWVEITNTRGMSQYADGGLVGTKPYVSSANYIDKMSDYCKSCHYAKTKKHGDKACPFNSLYWHFYERNRDKLEKNPRIGFVYPTLNKMKPDNRQMMMEQAEEYLADLNSL